MHFLVSKYKLNHNFMVMEELEKKIVHADSIADAAAMMELERFPDRRPVGGWYFRKKPENTADKIQEEAWKKFQVIGYGVREVTETTVPF